MRRSISIIERSPTSKGKAEGKHPEFQTEILGKFKGIQIKTMFDSVLSLCWRNKRRNEFFTLCIKVSLKPKDEV